MQASVGHRKLAETIDGLRRWQAGGSCSRTACDAKRCCRPPLATSIGLGKSKNQTGQLQTNSPTCECDGTRLFMGLFHSVQGRNISCQVWERGVCVCVTVQQWNLVSSPEWTEYMAQESANF